MKIVLLTFLLTGCVERQELREQACAHIAIRNHLDGVRGTWTHGEHCYARLYNGAVVREHDTGSAVYDLGPDRDHMNGFRCLGACHRENLYDVRISVDQRWCYCRDDKVSD